MITRGLQCSVLLAIAVLSFSAQCQTAPQGHPGNPSATRLARVVDEFWQHALKSRMYQGAVSNEALTALPDYSEQNEKQGAAFAQHILEELQGIKTAELDHQDQITLRLLQWETRRISEEARFYWFYFQITPYTSPIPLAQRVFREHPLRNQADLEDYLALLEKYPDFIGEISDSVHGQAERGIVLPQVEIPIAMAFLSTNLQEPEKNALFVSRERLSALDPAAATEFQKKAAAIITTRINPAFQRLVDYVGGDYAKKAPAAVGVSQYPGGREFYRYVVRVYTTLDITPEEVHRIGLEEVERTEAQMAEVRQAIGFKGSREEFHAFLKSDPRFFPRSPEEIEARLNSYLNRVLPLAPKYFLHTPKAPYGIQRLAPALEGGQTFGHYEQPSAGQPKGIYYYNGSHLQERSLLPLGALLLHELIPGHHFQLNLQAENQSLPAFRRVPVHGAYIEGWGNYSSALGREMGVYQDPYDVYGMLMTDMRHSVRLVVDTGMNALGWSREKAMDYMRRHLLDSETQIATESLRYSVDSPGQALAYKIGSRKIFDLREKAKRELGDKFDIREFHDWFLGSGSMPLSVLEEHIDWCIQRSRNKNQKHTTETRRSRAATKTLPLINTDKSTDTH